MHRKKNLFIKIKKKRRIEVSRNYFEIRKEDLYARSSRKLETIYRKIFKGSHIKILYSLGLREYESEPSLIYT